MGAPGTNHGTQLSNGLRESERGRAGADSPASEPDTHSRALVERCQQGGPAAQAAFDELLTAHQDAVYRAALRLMGDPDEALELAQDVLVTAFRKIAQFRGEAKFSTWLHRITLNLARNRWKSASRRPRALSLETGAASLDLDGDEPRPLDAPDASPSPRRRAETQEVFDALERAIAALPEPFREVVVLRHSQDLSYEEIAQALDAQIGTVKSRLARARELLRERMGDILDGYFES